MTSSFNPVLLFHGWLEKFAFVRKKLKTLTEGSDQPALLWSSPNGTHFFVPRNPKNSIFHRCRLFSQSLLFCEDEMGLLVGLKLIFNDNRLPRQNFSAFNGF